MTAKDALKIFTENGPWFYEEQKVYVKRIENILKALAELHTLYGTDGFSLINPLSEGELLKQEEAKRYLALAEKTWYYKGGK